MDNKGSILVITLGFILIFTLVGFGAIHFAGLQNQDAEKKNFSIKAFWIAEAGLERAKNKIQHDPTDTQRDFSEELESGQQYNAYSMPDPQCTWCQDRWLVHSEGLVKGQKRTIEAIIAKYDIKDVLMTQGPIKDLENCPMASLEIDCNLVKENVDFSFETVLNGLTKEDIITRAAHTYNNPHNSNDVNPIGGITVVNLTDNNSSLSLNTDNQSDSAFVVIDTTQVTSNSSPTINIGGNIAFQGIIWIIGQAEIKGTTTIHGAVFVQSGPAEETKVLGNAVLEYDAAAIVDAIDTIDADEVQIPQIISGSWEEI